MKSKREILSGWGMGLGLFLLAVVGILSYLGAHRLTDSSNWVSHTIEVISDLRQVHSDLIDVESSRRGYLLFHNEDDQTYTLEMMARIPKELAELRRLTSDNPRQQARLDRMDVLVSQSLVLLQQALSLKAGDPEQSTIHAQTEVVATARRQVAAEMENEERLLLVGRQRRAASESRFTALIIVGGFLLALMLVAGAGILGRLEIARTHKTEKALYEANASIASSLRDAEERARERGTLSDLAGRLQSCRSLAEGLPFISRGMEQLFPGESGAVLLTSASRNILEVAVSWGNHVATESSFAPDDCWALRQGRLQIADATDAIMRCLHLHPGAGRDAICLPLVGQGETLGVICHYSSSPGTQLPAAPSEMAALNRIRMATLAGAQISLAVANLQLRETLRNQSIRDVLTGLFNRRYMEESLAREFHRARRRTSPLAVMMVDIDHFKSFNDAYGHDLGDRLLREFGKFILIHTRAEDVACRYGGEEFTLIFPDAAAEGIMKRAEALRLGASQISIPLKDGGVATVTVSIGIALYPEHALTPEALLQAADAALYRAKAEGRDRFATAPASVLA